MWLKPRDVEWNFSLGGSKLIKEPYNEDVTDSLRINDEATPKSPSSKSGRRREWLARLTSLGRNCPSQTTLSPSQEISVAAVGPDVVSPSSEGFFGGHDGDSTLDELANEEEDDATQSIVPNVILTSNDFLDFVLRYPGNRVERITVKTVLERTQSSEDVPGEERSRLERRQTSHFEEFQLVQCPSAPMSLQMPPIILISGGGIFYFWKAGFTMYLSKHFDLSRCIFMGTSAGALASVATCCADSISKASVLAIKMAMEKQAWEKPYFLAGK